MHEGRGAYWGTFGVVFKEFNPLEVKPHSTIWHHLINQPKDSLLSYLYLLSTLQGAQGKNILQLLSKCVLFPCEPCRRYVTSKRKCHFEAISNSLKNLKMSYLNMSVSIKNSFSFLETDRKKK